MSGAFRLEGKVAVVTGGGGRLGTSFARALAGAGAQVVVAGRSVDRLDEVAQSFEPDRVVAASADVTDADSISRLFAMVDETFGGVNILVNNAGVASEAGLDAITSDELLRVLSVNVVGAVLCVQRAVTSMRSCGGGKIVNVGSIYGAVAPDQRLYEGIEMVRASPAYVASKSALVNLTRDLAVRLAPWNIQVNMLSPGGVEAGQPRTFKERYSARTPAGRLATPDDLAGTLVYLASPASDYVTGQDIRVDGGFTAW